MTDARHAIRRGRALAVGVLMGLVVLAPPPALAQSACPAEPPVSVPAFAWRQSANVKVFVKSSDFTPPQQAAIQGAFAVWNGATGLGANASAVKFELISTLPPSLAEFQADEWIIVYRHALSLPNALARTVRVPDGTGTRLNTAYLRLGPDVVDPTRLRQVVLHEVGHTFGLEDCPGCPALSSVMATNGAPEATAPAAPTTCDAVAARRVAGYQAANWSFTNQGTASCTIEGETETQSQRGSGTVTLNQTGPTDLQFVAQTGHPRAGTVNGSDIQVSGIFALAAEVIPGVQVNFSQNTYTASGTVSGNTIMFQGTGMAAGTVCLGGDCVPFSCTGGDTAVFRKLFVLTVAKSGTGTVSGQGVSCGTDCAETLPDRAVVALSASPVGVLTAWGGACLGNGACTVTTDVNRSVRARFGSAGAPPITAIALNRTGFRPNDPNDANPTLIIGLDAHNTTASPFDLYVGVLGPDGHTLAMKTPTGTVAVDLLGPVSQLQQLPATMTLPAGGAVTDPIFIDVTLPSIPAGTYSVFALAAKLGALNDGQLSAAEILGSDVKSFTVSP